MKQKKNGNDYLAKNANHLREKKQLIFHKIKLRNQSSVQKVSQSLQVINHRLISNKMYLKDFLLNSFITNLERVE